MLDILAAESFFFGHEALLREVVMDWPPPLLTPKQPPGPPPKHLRNGGQAGNTWNNDDAAIGVHKKTLSKKDATCNRVVKCKRGHELQSDVAEQPVLYSCNNCGEETLGQKGSEEIFRCDICDYDICTKCHLRQSSGEAIEKKRKPSSKQLAAPTWLVGWAAISVGKGCRRNLGMLGFH